MDISWTVMRWLYIIAFLLLQLGIIVGNTAFLSLIPDLIPSSQRGLARFDSLFVLNCCILNICQWNLWNTWDPWICSRIHSSRNCSSSGEIFKLLSSYGRHGFCLSPSNSLLCQGRTTFIE